MNYHSYLQHHGIKGQKWGVRRTPEQLGHKKSEKRVKIGDNLRRPFGVPVDFKDFTGIDGPEEKQSEMKRKIVDFGIDDDMRKVNPRTPGQKDDGTVNNCAYCTMAMEMRRRGYDVRARKKSNGITVDEIPYFFDGVDIKKHTPSRKEGESYEDYKIRSYVNLRQALEAQGSGARGLLIMKWLKTDTGHMIYYDVDSRGDVNFYDGQSVKKNNLPQFMLANPDKYSYGRLDTAEPTLNIGHAVVSISDRS